MTASESEKEQPFAESQSTSLKMLLISKKKRKENSNFPGRNPCHPNAINTTQDLSTSHLSEIPVKLSFVHLIIPMLDIL
jgi:hypothetical protein